MLFKKWIFLFFVFTLPARAMDNNRKKQANASGILCLLPLTCHKIEFYEKTPIHDLSIFSVSKIVISFSAQNETLLNKLQELSFVIGELGDKNAGCDCENLLNALNTTQRHLLKSLKYSGENFSPEALWPSNNIGPLNNKSPHDNDPEKSYTWFVRSAVKGKEIILPPFASFHTPEKVHVMWYNLPPNESSKLKLKLLIGKRSFTIPFKHEIADDLATATVAVAVLLEYDREGVVGAHAMLYKIPKWNLSKDTKSSSLRLGHGISVNAEGQVIGGSKWTVSFSLKQDLAVDVRGQLISKNEDE